MAFLQVNNVEVVGMAVTVPSTIEETVSIYEKWGDYDNFVATTGIERRRKSNLPHVRPTSVYVLPRS